MQGRSESWNKVCTWPRSMAAQWVTGEWKRGPHFTLCMSARSWVKCWKPMAGATQKSECRSLSEHRDIANWGSIGVGQRYPAHTSAHAGRRSPGCLGILHQLSIYNMTINQVQMLFLKECTKHVEAVNVNVFNTSFGSWIMSWCGAWIVNLEVEIQVSKLRELFHPWCVQSCHLAAPRGAFCVSGGFNM